ncbi:DMT family transporter [Agrobacterium vitis]|uniref:DMT family transporter n=1 Tax=Agrobacterium vitis TaxID=373 RepID=UPI00203585C9|nr:DMT family transporter [Agrobacterium vitis]MCM2453545.1 DMT family transporter [Agrobacterium vitis]
MNGFRNASLSRRPVAVSLWADLAVLGVAVVWGASYPVAKGALLYAPVLILILYRFLITTIIMMIVARREIVALSRGDILRGFLLGSILFSIFLAETYGVALTTATNTALIISLCVIFTPILDYGLSRKLPPPAIVASAIVCCVGVGILTGGINAFGAGDLLVLGAAVLRASMVVSTKRLMVGRQISSAALTAIQGFSVTTLTLVVVIAQFGVSSIAVDADPQFWFAVAFLSLFCTIAAFYIQNAAVRRTTPTRVGFLMGTEPFFGFLLAHLLLADPISATSVSGAALILVGTFAGILSENRKRS